MSNITYRFAAKAGGQKVEDKTIYPDYLILDLNRDSALEVLENIARQLRDSKAKQVKLYLLGEMTTDEETE